MAYSLAIPSMSVPIHPCSSLFISVHPCPSMLVRVRPCLSMLVRVRPSHALIEPPKNPYRKTLTLNPFTPPTPAAPCSVAPPPPRPKGGQYLPTLALPRQTFFLTRHLCISYIYTMTPTPPPRKLLLPPISPAAPGPLYEQIAAGLKREVSEGRLAPGAALPSFRRLARDLMVSLITVKRAYEELEREGIIYRKQGLGTFVSENGLDRSREVKEVRARELMSQAIREAREAGMTWKEIQNMFEEDR